LALDKRVVAGSKGSLEQLFSRAANTGPKEMAVIVKADVQGSSEAISASLAKLATDEVGIRVIHAAVGGITESDVSLARASGAVIIGFNVRAGAHAKEMATKEGVEIRYYSIIYNLIDDMKALLGGMLSPVLREEYLGSAEIRQVFKVSKSGKVAGCFVLDGVIKRGAGVRLLRDNIVIYEGKLKTLKRFKDDVKDVKEGYECGIAFENFDDMKEKDVVEAFEVIEEKREIS
jgi:translation initiation factor IF-2